jgi:hypothetical protein
MRGIVMRGIFVALALSLLSLPALAEDAAPPQGGIYADLTQIALSEDQVAHYIDATPQMRAAMGDAPADAPEPDAATMAKLDEIAKAHGFRDFDDYNTVAGNLALALDGVDPETRTYIGADKVILKSVAAVNADKTMSEADRKAALADLQAQLKAVPTLKFMGNIDLVVKYYDKLTGG